MFTYGDGIGNVDVSALLDFHHEHGRIGTVTGVRPTSRYGEMRVDGDVVTEFNEKPTVAEGFVSGGFFVFQREFFDYLNDDPAALLRARAAAKLARDGRARGVPARGFWMGMDTYRDFTELNDLWASGRAAWKVWAEGSASRAGGGRGDRSWSRRRRVDRIPGVSSALGSPLATEGAPRAQEDGLPAVPGNSAKLYCLSRLDRLAARGPLTILDLGCGSGYQAVPLLRRHPGLRYVGVEPNPASAAAATKALAPFDARVLTAPAYDVEVSADVILSFSVFEHVYRRDRYVASIARNLRDGGVAFVNYDAGHFLDMGTKEWAKTVIQRVLARVGNERYYERFVPEQEFRRIVSDHGLEIEDAKMFNSLKRIYHALPEAQREEFMPRWLEFELYLNDLGIEYRDELASIFTTRNFILRKRGHGTLPNGVVS